MPVLQPVGSAVSEKLETSLYTSRILYHYLKGKGQKSSTPQELTELLGLDLEQVTHSLHYLMELQLVSYADSQQTQVVIAASPEQHKKTRSEA